MPGSASAEFYFITAMMILIVIISVTTLVFFARTYKREMREKKERLAAKLVEKQIAAVDTDRSV